MPRYQESILKNGLRLITSTSESVSTAAVSLWLAAGSRYEKKQQLGYSHLLEHLLYKNMIDLHNNTDKNRMGAYINGFTSRENMRFVIEASTKYVDDILATLSVSLGDFGQDLDEFKREKEVIMQEMQMARDDSKKLILSSALQKFFGDHPLSQEPLGLTETVQNATVEGLKKHRDSLFVPQNSAVIMVSSLSHDQILSLAVKYFESWESSNGLPYIEKKHRVSKNHENYLYIPNSNKQTSIIINFHTPGVENMKEEAALVILASYLGGGSKAFLQEKLRHEAGLVYTVNVSIVRYTDAGMFQITTYSSEPIEVIKIIFDSLSTFLNNISPAEIEETKEKAINVFDRFNSNPRNELMFLGQSFILFNRLFEPDAYKKLLREVTYEDVINVSKKYLNRNNSLVAVLGPEDIKDKI